MRFYRVLTLSLLIAVGVSMQANAQKDQAQRTSPAAVASMRYKDAYVKVTYGRPYKRGRVIFGNVVPYGQVWRTGANEATEITTTKDLLLNSVPLKAGTYSIFTIPDKIKWTIIINTDVGLWGSYNYNPKMDIIRFDIPVQSIAGEPYEAFTIEFNQKNDQAHLDFLWDQTKVSIPIRFLN